MKGLNNDTSIYSYKRKKYRFNLTTIPNQQHLNARIFINKKFTNKNKIVIARYVY